MIRRPPSATLFPSTTLFRSADDESVLVNDGFLAVAVALALVGVYHLLAGWPLKVDEHDALVAATAEVGFPVGDRKSTRLNSSHANISYAVFCLTQKSHTLRH